MKIVLTVAEIEEMLLDKLNEAFATSFNQVTFDGYSNFRTATFEIVEPEVMVVGEES